MTVVHPCGKLGRTQSGLVEEFGEGSDEYDTAIDEYYTIERERLLLHMLHAASRQFGPLLRPETKP